MMKCTVKSCIYWSDDGNDTCDCVFTECIYEEEDEFGGLGRG